jgi:hypothetical protein
MSFVESAIPHLVVAFSAEPDATVESTKLHQEFSQIRAESRVAYGRFCKALLCPPFTNSMGPISRAGNARNFVHFDHRGCSSQFWLR